MYYLQHILCSLKGNGNNDVFVPYYFIQYYRHKSITLTSTIYRKSKKNSATYCVFGQYIFQDHGIDSIKKRQSPTVIQGYCSWSRAIFTSTCILCPSELNCFIKYIYLWIRKVQLLVRSFF